MLSIASEVALSPGQTAHWYGTRWVRRWRWGRVYAAFRRALRYGMVRAERDGNVTRYYPVPDWRSRYPDLCEQ